MRAIFFIISLICGFIAAYFEFLFLTTFYLSVLGANPLYPKAGEYSKVLEAAFHSYLKRPLYFNISLYIVTLSVILLPILTLLISILIPLIKIRAVVIISVLKFFLIVLFIFLSIRVIGPWINKHNQFLTSGKFFNFYEPSYLPENYSYTSGEIINFKPYFLRITYLNDTNEEIVIGEKQETKPFKCVKTQVIECITVKINGQDYDGNYFKPGENFKTNGVSLAIDSTVINIEFPKNTPFSEISKLIYSLEKVDKQYPLNDLTT